MLQRKDMNHVSDVDLDKSKFIATVQAKPLDKLGFLIYYNYNIPDEE